MAVPYIQDVIKHIEQLKIRARENILKQVNIKKLTLDAIKNSFILKNPLILYEGKKQRIDLNSERLQNILKYKMQESKNRFSSLIDKLELLNPINTLKRGYSITYLNDKVINNINDLKEKDELNLKFHNGQALVEVKKIVEE